MDAPAYRFTVFTPTHNRSRVLRRPYESLKQQTFRNFEWVVVDDGSTDETADLVASWIAENPFPIRYIRQEHSGKHIAFNRAVSEARGELFLPLDSDDGCVPHALARFDELWRPLERSHMFTGLTARCKAPNGTPLGDPLPSDPFDATSQEMAYRHRIGGEWWGFHRTSILRRHPFPDIPGALFVPEGLVWHAIGGLLKTRFVNEPLRVYWNDQSDSLSRSANPARHAVGMATWFRFMLANESGWAGVAPDTFRRAAANYVRFSLHAGQGIRQQWDAMRQREARVLYMIGAGPGIAAYARDRLRHRQ